MHINEFKAIHSKEQKKLEKKLESFKLEKVLSLWYVIRSASKAFIMGSKG